MFNLIDDKTYHLKNFVSKKVGQPVPAYDLDDDEDTDGDDQWSASLLKGKLRIGLIKSPTRQGPVTIEFHNDHAKATYQQDLKDRQDALKPRQVIGMDPTSRWMIELASVAYMKRRLDLKAKNNTIFRLQGDPEHAFHMVRGLPYSLEMEGRLRVSYGQRLTYIHRSPTG